MPQINNINDAGQALGPSAPGGGTQKTASSGFGNVLDKALGTEKNQKAGLSRASGLGEIASTGPVVRSLPDLVADRTGQLLDRLEAYSNQLADPEIALKRIAPELKAIQADAGALEKQASGLTKEAGPLKAIAAQTVATAQTEYLKFQRGDYLS